MGVGKSSKRKESYRMQQGVRHKGKLVPKGYAREEGINYNKVSSPVIKHFPIRTLLVHSWIEN